MKKKPLLSMFLIGFLCIFTVGNLFAEAEAVSTYGHISFVDKAATIIRQDKSEYKATINLPVAPGDQVLTGENGRCEIQFDNGSVIRLDKQTRLKVTTVLAPTLTTKWKVTTLHLMRGQIYAMIQSYNREMFQVITPNAALDLKKRTATTIRIKENGDTFLYADKGKYPVLYGEAIKEVQTDKVKPKQGFLVTSDHKFKTTTDKRDLEFVSWNEYVNRNFKDLHYGISKVPKKIYKHNKGLVKWAEKWSSLFGEWVYDDVFGYVWKPADEIFAFSKRPFFHANFTRINGKLFLVPQQAWGWVPAHMGTWVWMKWGWTWVPGDAFTSGFDNQFNIDNHFFPTRTLDYFIGEVYGSYSLWYTYCSRGIGEWRIAYRDSFGRNPDEPRKSLKRLPVSARNIISKLNKTPFDKIKNKLGDNRPNSMISRNQLANMLKSHTGKPTNLRKTAVTAKPATLSKKAVVNRKVTSNTGKANILRNKAIMNRTPHPGSVSISKEPPEMMRSRNNKGIRVTSVQGFRDFNPDKRWAYSKGYSVGYSSRLNAVVCPNLKVHSRDIPPHLRGTFRKGSSRTSSGRSTGYYTRGTSSSTASTATTSTSSGAPVSRGSLSSSGGSRGGNISGVTKKK